MAHLVYVRWRFLRFCESLKLKRFDLSFINPIISIISTLNNYIFLLIIEVDKNDFYTTQEPRQCHRSKILPMSKKVLKWGLG